MKTNQRHIIEFELENLEKERIEDAEQTLCYLADILSDEGFMDKKEILYKAQLILANISWGKLESH